MTEGKRVSFVLSGSKKARCLLLLSLSHPRKIKVVSQVEKRKKVLCCLDKKTKYPETAVQTSEVVRMGTYHTKGSQNTPKNNLEIHWIPSGFLFFCVFFPFVRPHATNRILSTGKKKKSTEQWRWGRALETVLDKEGKELSHRITDTSNRQEPPRGMRGNTFFISGRRVQAPSAISTSLGSGICGTASTVLCPQGVG